MSWAKLADDFHAHPKVLAVGHVAALDRLHVSQQTADPGGATEGRDDHDRDAD